MYEHKNIYPLVRMAKVLKVSESGYYAWRKKMQAAPSPNDKLNEELLDKILEIFIASRGSFGSRKITRIINSNRQKPVNHKRIERIMRENGIVSRAFKRFRCTTDSKHCEEIANNLIDRDFTADKPNQKMVSDTTVIETKQGDIYAAGIIDLYGRMPVGLAISKHNDRFLVIDALEDIVSRGCGSEGCIMHSDRGSTYASKDYRVRLSHYGLLCSMSKKGDCWDNAPMESFWGKLKEEWLNPKYDTEKSGVSKMSVNKNPMVAN